MKCAKLSCTVFFSVFFLVVVMKQQAEMAEVQDNYKILINIPARSLALYEGEERVRLYPVALGKPYTQTPVGYYKIRTKEKNPSWIDPGNPKNVIYSGPTNPLGYRWMQIQGNYGIHGTNKPSSIGKFDSNGCIRLKEEQVEELFDLVKIGTPVEIMYNRVVIDMLKNNMITYYIYPDAYDKQALDVTTVKQWLTGYGIENFESDADILSKIKRSDGKPTYIGKIYPLEVNGAELSHKVVDKNDILYLPVQEIADYLGTSIVWNGEEGTASSAYGTVPVTDRNGTLYIQSEDAEVLFHRYGYLNDTRVYVIGKSKQSPVMAPSSISKESNER
ncbi:hypothetical protein TAMA11512_14710 [Selenomonas sp. TAMA-11512]|uniref:L,D-transpeptidase n=1 Tax=Selenomonas sp. TAMA-11512 TaxID=3095337 RepID=UPI00308A5AB5|nr:hypothetical protein TAMA11512_14710 [Selenomonas sp. TAMA-11512]